MEGFTEVIMYLKNKFAMMYQCILTTLHHILDSFQNVRPNHAQRQVSLCHLLIVNRIILQNLSAPIDRVRFTRIEPTDHVQTSLVDGTTKQVPQRPHRRVQDARHVIVGRKSDDEEDLLDGDFGDGFVGARVPDGEEVGDGA